MANKRLIAGHLDAAEGLLKPVLSRKQFHYDNFGAFSSTYIDLFLAQNNQNGAQSWLNLWQSVHPDHPELRARTARVAGTGLLNKFAKLSQWRSPE